MGNPKIMPGEEAVSAGQAEKNGTRLLHLAPGLLLGIAYLKMLDSTG